MPGPISHVMFDFDGTLSWLRHGWPEMMFEVFRPHLPLRKGESETAVHHLLLSEILSLNGKSTIFQMQRFVEIVRHRGGTCPSAESLLEAYQARLDAAIRERSQKLLKEQSSPDEFVVFGARAFLEQLKHRGLTLIILSGTIEHRVKQEAGWLGLSRFFESHIYGSTPNQMAFSKRQVIDRLLHEEKIRGHHLLSFGDGPVEIAETKAVGGIAIGVASDENENGSGKMDSIKERILRDAGADAVIADYREATMWMEKVAAL